MINVLADLTGGWLSRLLGGAWSDDGDAYYEKRISSEKALSYAPIWHGVNKISGHIGQLPICVYKRLPKGSERDRDHNLHKLMRRPNAYQTPIVFKELLATHCLLDGNGRAAIVRRGGLAVELIPLLPDCSVTTMIDGIKIHGSRPSEDDRLRLFFPSIDGKKDGLIQLNDADVMHIPGLSLDGINGLALRKIAQRNLGASISTETRLAKQLDKGFGGSLMLQAGPNTFRGEKDAQEFMTAFEERHYGKEKAGLPGLLRDGMTANVLGSTNKDAEMLENRKFQRQDAALYLGLESILGDDTSVSYNSLEQKSLAYLMNCLNKLLKRWEEELEYKLLPRREFDAESYFVRFNTAALLKSDFQTSITSLAGAIAATIMSPNEARDKLDMNPYDGGDEFRNPAITPGAAALPATKAPPADGNATQIARRAIDSRLKQMISTEAKRVCEGASQATSKGKNFLQWIDSFYDTNWLPKLADTIEELGIDRDEATSHCTESRARILEVCDYSTNENLAENVAKCVSSWSNRANSIGVKNVLV